MSFQRLKWIPILVLVLCFGCKSKPAEPIKTVHEAERPMEKAIGLPDVIPEDWPLTREEVQQLGRDHLKLDTKGLESLGIHSRKEIVALAYKVLKSDLSPIDRDIDESFSGRLQGSAYQLLGLYGSLEDAERHFRDVKGIVHRGGAWSEPLSDIHKHLELVRSLGFYLMRDHFMPQKDRSLMIDIEDYLLSCTVIDTPSCWPYSDLDDGNDDLRRYALNALAYGCSERAKERIKTYTSLPPPDLFLTEGKYDQEEMEKTEQRGDEIRQKLKPVLPEKELEE